MLVTHKRTPHHGNLRITLFGRHVYAVQDGPIYGIDISPGVVMWAGHDMSIIELVAAATDWPTCHWPVGQLCQYIRLRVGRGSRSNTGAVYTYLLSVWSYEYSSHIYQGNTNTFSYCF